MGASVELLALPVLLELEPVWAWAIDSLPAAGAVVVDCSALGTGVCADGAGVTVCAMAAPIMPAVATVDAAVIQNFVVFIFCS
jgi:hypothetical protein